MLQANQMQFVSIDFETANEKRDSACSIGIAVVDNGAVVSRTAHLIRPVEMRFESFNTAIHGITEDDVSDAPTFAELWGTLQQQICGKLVVAHNAAFDMSVLRYTLYANGIPFPELQYLCSLKLSSRVWPTLASHRLAFLAAHHGIELDHHDAESDAVAAAILVLKAGQEHAESCAVALAKRFDVSVGAIAADGSWRPSSAPRVSGAKSIKLTVPDDFDIVRHPFYECDIVFTGTMSTMQRSCAEKLVEQVGGRAKSTVSRLTEFLVCGRQDLRMLANGDSESSKLKRAKELREAGAPIQIIGEEEFLRLLTEPLPGKKELEGVR